MPNVGDIVRITDPEHTFFNERGVVTDTPRDGVIELNLLYWVDFFNNYETVWVTAESLIVEV